MKNILIVFLLFTIKLTNAQSFDIELYHSYITAEVYTFELSYIAKDTVRKNVIVYNILRDTFNSPSTTLSIPYKKGEGLYINLKRKNKTIGGIQFYPSEIKKGQYLVIFLNEQPLFQFKKKG